jgi:quercetin dioxygenase-like cupin family protein
MVKATNSPIPANTIPPNARKGFALKRGEGRSVWYAGNLMEFKLDRESSGGGLTFIDVMFRRGEEPPVHVHHNEDELYFVLEGEVRFWVGEEEFEAPPGTLVFLPRDVPHALLVENPGVARLLLQWFPSNRLEEYFIELGQEATGAVLPPPPGPLDTEKMAATLAKYGIEVLGPPPSQSGLFAI